MRAHANLVLYGKEHELLCTLRVPKPLGLITRALVLVTTVKAKVHLKRGSSLTYSATQFKHGSSFTYSA